MKILNKESILRVKTKNQHNNELGELKSTAIIKKELKIKTKILIVNQ